MKTISSIIAYIQLVFPAAPYEMVVSFAQSIIDAKEIERKQTLRKPHKAKEILSKLKQYGKRH